MTNSPLNLKFWHHNLEELLPMVTFPIDFDREESSTESQIESYTQTLAPDLASALDQFSQTQNTRQFILFLATLQSLLYFHTGANKITIASPIFKLKKNTILRLLRRN